MKKAPENDKIRLEHVVEAINEINTFANGKIIDDLYGNSMFRSAVYYQLTIIGEAVNKISEQTLSLLPLIEWRKIVDTRNIITHEYALVDEEVVWDIIQKKLPELEKAVKTLLKEI